MKNETRDKINQKIKEIQILQKEIIDLCAPEPEPEPIKVPEGIIGECGYSLGILFNAGKQFLFFEKNEQENMYKIFSSKRIQQNNFILKQCDYDDIQPGDIVILCAKDTTIKDKRLHNRNYYICTKRGIFRNITNDDRVSPITIFPGEMDGISCYKVQKEQQ